MARHTINLSTPEYEALKLTARKLNISMKQLMVIILNNYKKIDKHDLGSGDCTLHQIELPYHVPKIMQQVIRTHIPVFDGDLRDDKISIAEYVLFNTVTNSQPASNPHAMIQWLWCVSPFSDIEYNTFLDCVITEDFFEIGNYVEREPIDRSDVKETIENIEQDYHNVEAYLNDFIAYIREG